ncbi:uncharacterized protein LOC116105152 [Pistacia vera]|uniref:uncharacterized protein LOC116105152 n=1 Tax=Pistacia vera TaxID=55513 RepID=UPI001262C511|nr:uncharacterized protein LOC116105152 [Pistacia vera]
MINAASGGALNNKTPEEAYNLIEIMATNNYLRSSEQNLPKRVAGVPDVDVYTAFAAQLSAIQKQLGTVLKPEQANYVNNFQRGKGIHTPTTILHEGSILTSHEATNKPKQPPGFQAQELKSNLENALTMFIDETSKRFEKNEILVQNQSTSIRNLETQIRQIHNILTGRVQGVLSSDTEKNPKEQVHAITLRTGRTLENSKDEKRIQEQEKDLKEEKKDDRCSDENGSRSDYEISKDASFVDDDRRCEETCHRGDRDFVPESSEVGTHRRGEKTGSRDNRESNHNASLSHQAKEKKESTIPYPHRLKNQKLDKQFGKFIDVFRSLHINIPFVDMLEQMPKYVQFLKEILTHKRKFEEHDKVTLTEECNALVQKKSPLKLRDQMSVTIPYIIDSCYFDKVLCDLGASINLMSFSIYGKLRLGEVKPTTMSLQLPITYPRRVVEDVLIKVDKLIFPVDFTVLDMEENRKIPLSLRRPFLAMARTLIDVHQGKLILRV